MAEDVFGIVGSLQAAVFRVERVVAEGGFGVVYRAHHEGFKAAVALKCLKIPGAFSAEQRQAFLQGMRRVQQPVHPGRFELLGIAAVDGSQSQMVGVDAALDYPLFFQLKPVVKASAPPSDLVGMYASRKRIEANILSSHGDATRFFVTFLDNHDVKERIRFAQPGDEHKYDDQVTLGIACLYCLPGIPCLYYGTEQGLHALLDLFIDRIDLRQAQRRQEGADQALARQVDPFGESATQHREADAPPALGEAGQELLLLGFTHAARLAPAGKVGMERCKHVGYLLQVFVAAEEGQVVAWLF